MRVIRLVGLAVVLLAIGPSIAWAYIDPGAGSMVYQMLIAAIVAGGVVLRGAWRRIRGYGKSDGGRPGSTDAHDRSV